MADDVKTGIRLTVEGEEEFSRDLENAAASTDNFKSSAEGAAESAGALAEAMAQASADQDWAEGWQEVAGATAALAEGFAQQAAGVEKLASAFFGAVDDAAAYGDKIDKQSQKFGISAQAYQKWDYVLKQSGTSMSSMGGVFDRLRATQSGYVKAASEDLELLGLSLGDISAMAKEDAFAAIIAGLQGVADINLRDSIAKDLLGSGYKQLGPVMNMTAEETQELIGYLETLGGVMSDEDVKAAAAYGDSVDNINLKLDNFKRSILAEFMPALTELRENVIENGSLDRLADTVASLAESGVGLLAFLVDHSDEAVTAVEAIGAAWGAWKGAEIVKTLVGNVQQLYGWLGLLGNALGIGAGAAAGGVGLLALSVGTLVDEAATLEGIGYLGNGRELREYADNIAYWEAALESAQTEYDNLTMYGGDLTMAQNSINFAAIALGHAREEYAAMQEAAAGSEAAPRELAETAQESAAQVEQAAAAMLETITESAGELRDDFITGAEGLAGAAADEIVAANDAMAANMAIVSGNAEIWGQDMMISLANGIRLGANDWVLPAVDELAAAIDARIGFSEPEIGPLSDFHTFAPDMMELFARGVTDYAPLVHDAVTDAFDLGALIQPPTAAGASLNYGGVNVTFQVQEGQDGRALFEEFSYWLQNEMAQEGAVFAQ